MKLALLLIASVVVTACDKPLEQTAFIPDCREADERERLAKFVVDCSAAANPKSDEEGEDLVKQCEQTGRTTLCPLRTVRFWCEHYYQAPEFYCRRLK